MKHILIVAVLLLVLNAARAQVETLKKDPSTNAITESFTIGSGKTLTIGSGGTLNATSGTLVGISTGLTIGTSTITSGTSGTILYNNAGTLGEILTSSTGASAAGKVPLYGASSELAAGGGFVTSVTSGVARATMTPIGFYLLDTSDRSGRFAKPTLTSSRVWTGPDASGTLITTGNLTDIVTTGNVTSGSWNGTLGAISGANLTTLSANNLSTGTVPTARLGSGTANSSTYLRGDSTWGNLQAELDLKAPLASPTFTGTPSLPTGTTAVTQSAGDNSTKLATTAYVQPFFKSVTIGSNVASAASVNLDATTGDIITITGTTAISSITLTAGQRRLVMFADAVPITAGATLIPPEGESMIMGGFAWVIGYAGGVVRIVPLDNRGAITNENVSYIRSYGNDSTAAKGNPNLPYATIQAAFDDGSNVFDVGFCDAGPLDTNTLTALYVFGRAGLYSTVGPITTNGHDLLVYDMGYYSYQLLDCDTSDAGVGASAGDITLYGVWATGDMAANGTAGSGPNSPGGNAGDITIKGHNLLDTSLGGGNVAANGGTGGDGDGTDPSGDGGNGGNIYIKGKTEVQGTVSAVKGSAGSDGGGGSGNPGTDGTATVGGNGGLPTIPTPNIGGNTVTYASPVVQNSQFIAPSLQISGALVPTVSGSSTLTNKRITRRVSTITSSATPSVNTDNFDCVDITALGAAITSMTSNLSGAPVNFDRLEYRIKDNGTARAITWGASFASGVATLPTTTVVNKALTVVLEWDSVQSKWMCLQTGSYP